MKLTVLLYNNFSLRTRIIIASILCILLPSLLTFVLSNHQIKEEQVEDAVIQTESSLQMLDRNIKEYFDDLFYLMNFLQFDSNITSILRQNNQRSDEDMSSAELDALDYINISNQLNSVSKLLKPSYVTILLDSGFIFTNYVHDTPHRLTSERWFQEILPLRNFETNWLGVHPTHIERGQEENPYLISIIRQFSLSEKYNVVVLLSIAEKEIRSFFEESVLDKQQLFLIDSDGVVLSHNKEEYILKQFPHMDQIENENDDYTLVEIDHTNYVAVSYPLAYGDWVLVSMTPYESMVGGINAITNNTLLMQIVFYIIFLIILILIIRRLTKPVSKLSYVMNEVKKGNLNVRSGITGKGDIERLGHNLDSMIDEIEAMIAQIKIEEDGKRKAELEMLQAQINPHFLFNILNSIRLKILLKGDAESSELIQSLSQLLRMTINRNNEYIPLEKEIETIEHYVRLMNFRGSYHIEVIKELEPDLLNEKVPRFFLQPIIENSIIHGYEQNGGIIRIEVWKEPGYLMIKVVDQGKGMREEDLAKVEQLIKLERVDKNKSSFTGIGVTNVYQRLMMIYGEKFRMEIENHQLEGTQVTFFIPRKQEGLGNV